MDAAPMLKRKGAEPPEPSWLDDGVPVPATKTRRLDSVVVPPVEPAGAVFAQATAGAGVPQPLSQLVEEVPVSGEVEPAVVLAPAAANDERAIVVYQPAEAARGLLHGPLRPEAPLRVNPDLIRSIKGTVLQEANYYHHHRALYEELASRDDENPDLAMVPWTPAHRSQDIVTDTAYSSAPATEMMVDADQDDEGASMEVEASHPAPPAVAALYGGQAFHHQQQWPPQHCMAPQQLQVPAASYSYHPSPVTWSW